MYEVASSSIPLSALIIIFLKTLAILVDGGVLSYYCFNWHSSSDENIKHILCMFCVSS